MKSVSRLLLFAAIFCFTAFGQEALTVKLVSPLSTASVHKGEPFHVQVVAPDALKGDTMLGEVIQSKGSGKSKGTSVLEIRFDSLQHQTTNVPVAATIDSVSNSKGQASVDDQNLSLEASSKTPAAASAHHFGSAFGGLVSKAANISSEVGDAAGGAAEPAPTITLTARGPQIELGTGSELAISVKSHGGPELASLPANAAPEAAAASSSGTSSGGSGEAGSSAAGSIPAAATDASGQPILTATKIDFIPGEKTVFFDDFSDMASDEPPPHWKVRGDGPVDLRTGGGVHELTITKNDDLYSSKFSFPTNFTVEIEAVAYKGSSNNAVYFLDASGDYKAHFSYNVRDDGTLQIDANDSKEDIGSGTARFTFGKPFTFAVWAQQGRVRVYVDGTRVVDANQTQIPALAGGIRLHSDFYGGSGPIGIRSVRVAESAPDFSKVLATTGKYVTHGIYFDTDSDKLKPESAPVIKQAAAALEKNPNLKLEIDGATDSTGNAQHNQELSQKRAEAVRGVLIAQFGVDAGRLTAAGLGASKPIASNDTPEGRAQNRRVEFVKK
jgi:OmpA-OmpF porin, OOP family